jgi:thioredoxin reductase (NADPH)
MLKESGMAKPFIMTVDDEPQVLNAVERDLRQRYGTDYRILKAGSGAEALEAVRQLKRRDAPLALFLVDQRMPAMTGIEFLAEARVIFPEAKKALLTAYADTEAAIASINSIGLDHYLMKPWDPPDQHLYPVLDDLLEDWVANVPAPFEGIRVVGTLWSASSHAAKDFLARNRIPYRWMDLERDAEARTLLETVGREHRGLPAVFFPDGSVLLEPDQSALAGKIGMKTQAALPFYDLVIVGGGPSGLGAAVYGASEGLRTLMIEKDAVGGQAGTSSRIENYLGFPNGLAGLDLARRAEAQARRLGAEILAPQEVTGVRVEDPYRIVRLRNDTEVSCHALLIATGVTVQHLNVPGIEPLTGAGVYYGAAVTEAAHYRDQHVFVVGGANSAGQGAMFFSRFASRVTILVRASALEKGMSQYLVDQIKAQPNIDVRLRSEVRAVHGTSRLEAITVRNADTDQTEILPAAALFLFIGAVPHTQMVADVVERNGAGFILTGADLVQDGKPPKNWNVRRDPLLLETSVPGIFAAGDVRQGAVRRVASAVGEGAITVGLVHQYLKTV